MPELAKRIINLKEQLREAETEESKIDGKISSLLERLHKSCGCKDEEEAEEKNIQLDRRIEKIQGELERDLNELETEMIGE